MMQNPQYAADFESLMTLCQERNVAVQTIKSITRGPWGDKQPNRATWYEPLEDEAEIEAAVHWVLSRPGLFLDTVGDIHLLPKVLAAAARFDPNTQQQIAESILSEAELIPLFV